MKFKLHHVALSIKNTDESIEWYKNNFGFEVTRQYEKNGRKITQLKLDDIRIELFDCGESTKPLPDYRKELKKDLCVIGTKHLCLEVEDLDKTIQSLNAKGIKTREVDTAGFGGKYTFINDCNGILIELYQSD